MAKITGINHITFATKDLNVSIEFYCKMLEATVVVKWRTGAYLLLGNLWLCLSYDENTKLCSNKEYTHIAFDIAADDFETLKEKILNKKNIIIWKENKSEGESLYILDPDFNKLEIHASRLKNRIEFITKNPLPDMELNHDLIAKL